MASSFDPARFQADYEALRAQVAAMQGQILALMQPAATALERSQSTLGDGTKVAIRPDEVGSMRALFDMFDTNNSGTINADALRKLHVRLGEPISAQEAEEAVRMMDESGEVSFESFLRWWDRDHEIDPRSGKRRGDRYRSKFRFLRARVGCPEVARIVTRSSGEGFQFRVHFFIDNSDGTLAESSTPLALDEETAASVPVPRPPPHLIPISPWHDVPLRNRDGTFNVIVEIPKWTRAKYEIATTEDLNPIKQDTQNGRLRDYMWGDMLGNYGAFPQTWEDPHHLTVGTGTPGDNDPLDVIEIGTKQWATGSVVAVKIIGVFALIDGGETDWKVVAISKEDPLADVINDVEDVEAHIPGLLEAIQRWFRLYKTATGKPPNDFGFDGRCKPRAFALQVVEETHGFWKKLIQERRTV